MNPSNKMSAFPLNTFLLLPLPVPHVPGTSGNTFKLFSAIMWDSFPQNEENRSWATYIPFELTSGDDTSLITTVAWCISHTLGLKIIYICLYPFVLLIGFQVNKNFGHKCNNLLIFLVQIQHNILCSLLPMTQHLKGLIYGFESVLKPAGNNFKSYTQINYFQIQFLQMLISCISSCVHNFNCPVYLPALIPICHELNFNSQP